MSTFLHRLHKLYLSGKSTVLHRPQRSSEYPGTPIYPQEYQRQSTSSLNSRTAQRCTIIDPVFLDALLSDIYIFQFMQSLEFGLERQLLLLGRHFVPFPNFSAESSNSVAKISFCSLASIHTWIWRIDNPCDNSSQLGTLLTSETLY
jgi:hypothetical protein